MNRIDRISAILIQLQSRKVVKAQDIADRFEISLRTVYRDIKTLEEAGIPIIGETGIGYSIMDGYRLPPVMFTREEATAFLTAEKLVEKLTDPVNGDNYKSAMYKIKSVLRSTEKDFLENIENHIEVIKRNKHLKQQPPEQNALQAILKSVSEKRVVTIHYFANYKQEHSKRNIEPVGVVYFENAWHLIAYCQLRNDYRDFRLDRISRLMLTDEIFARQHMTLKDYLKEYFKNRSDLETIVIKVRKDILPHIETQKYNNGFVSQTEENGWVEMTFMTPYLEGFTRWYMMFADAAIPLQPQALKDRVKAIASAIRLTVDS